MKNQNLRRAKILKTPASAPKPPKLVVRVKTQTGKCKALEDLVVQYVKVIVSK